ncbi:sensor domain-containing diguanylate cyclase [Echinimonas agarilytica]|nr:diguanylate cyclase [Echinimonas agarilytica]
MSRIAFLLFTMFGILGVAFAAQANDGALPAMQINEVINGRFEHHAKVIMSSGIFVGILFVMAMYNLFIFWHSRTISFLYYGLYALCVVFMTASAIGLLSLLWQPLIWYQQQIALGFGAVAAVCIGLFADELLGKLHTAQWLRVCLRITGLAVLLTGIVMVFSWNELSIKLVMFFAFIMVLFLVVVGSILTQAKHNYGMSYAFAWTSVAVGFALTLLIGADVLSWPFSHRIPLMAGICIEVVVVSFVLAGSFSDAQTDMIVAHKESLESYERAQRLQQQALQAQAVATDELERKVQERTFELEVTLRELEETNRRLEEQSTVDALTGVKNRKHFDRRFVAEFRRSRREQTPLSVMMLDIDRFKNVNDTYGHLVGDECIRQVAQRIQSVIKRPTDVVTRYGGEEFAVILPATHIDGAKQVAQDIITAVRQTPLITSDGPLTVTISAGISDAVANNDLRPEDLLTAADQALYKAKSAGRDQYQVQAVGDSNGSPHASLPFDLE